MAKLIADSAATPQPDGTDQTETADFRVQKNADHEDQELINEGESPFANPAMGC
jgi:hypothetical protein